MANIQLYLTLSLASAVICFDGLKIQDLSPDTAEELRSIQKFVDVKANCTGHPQPQNPNYLLFNRNNQETPITLSSSNLNEISAEKKVIVIIPGWLTNYTTSYIKQLRNAYFQRYDCNIIVIDWAATAFKPYSYIYCDVPRLGLQASKFICQVGRTLEIPLSDIHIVGYSFGAQIAGYIGRNTDLQCDEKIGRITGLEAAGPIYEYASVGQSLTKSDALFVDAIHTTSSLGMWKNCGQVDFHPNCKTHNQPGCLYPPPTDNDTLVSESLCSSVRSIDYMIESINSNQLIGVSCGLCSRLCQPDIINEVYAIMGEDCREVPKPAKNFLVWTRASPPYGQGMLPYAIVSQSESLFS